MSTAAMPQSTTARRGTLKRLSLRTSGGRVALGAGSVEATVACLVPSCLLGRVRAPPRPAIPCRNSPSLLSRSTQER